MLCLLPTILTKETPTGKQQYLSLLVLQLLQGIKDEFGSHYYKYSSQLYGHPILQ